jgi:hypothetical protein
MLITYRKSIFVRNSRELARVCSENYDKNPKSVISAIYIGKIVVLKPVDKYSLRNISHSVSSFDDGTLDQLLGLINDLREITPSGKTHVREITAPSKTHEMDWSEEVREEHSNSGKISIQMSVDDNIE